MSRDRCDAAFKDESDFGTEWFGNLLLQLGHSKDDIASVTREMHVRGSIHEFGLRQDSHGTPGVWMVCSLAWEPNPLTLQSIIDKHYPGLGFVMLASEPGGGIYVNTDKNGDFFGTRWGVDYETEDAGCGWEEFDSTEQAAEGLSELVGMSEDELLAALEGGDGSVCGDLDAMEKIRKAFKAKHPEDDSYIDIHYYDEDY